jgi:hypothetical protein
MLGYVSNLSAPLVSSTIYIDTQFALLLVDQNFALRWVNTHVGALSFNPGTVLKILDRSRVLEAIKIL